MSTRPEWLHPVSRVRLTEFAASAPHALIIEGEQGIGVLNAGAYLAEIMKAVVTYVVPEKKEVIDRVDGTITVEIIRRLYDQTKTVSASERVVLIEQAETMGTQAQNAFLKLLEEPNESTHFVLLTTNASHFLPTITSRAQHIALQRTSRSTSEAILDSYKVSDATRRSQLLFIADGLPELLTELITDDAAFEARAAIMRDARELVQGNAYTRLKLAQKYKESRETALTLLGDAMRLVQRTVADSASSVHVRLLDQLLTVEERIRANGNVRLQLASLMVYYQ